MSYPQPYGKYVLLERLGMGGMSEVDLARQRMGDRDFVRFLVIKRVKTDHSGDESFIRMFKDEARITSQLHHANIGQVYDFGREGNEYYLALEYVQGIDVREIVNTLRDRGQRVPVRIALRIIADVLDALDYAHTKRDPTGVPMNIVHRDVNPRNIMVSVQGEVKLIDFGVAKAAGRLERTKTDHVKGKFSYMAPEQIKGEAIDGRADLFALALTLHELLAGYGPFFGLNQVQIVHRLLHGKMPEMPEVPDMKDDSALLHLHDHALARDAAERYPSAAAMKADLLIAAELAGGLPTREQLAQFLQKVDPSLLPRLQRKIEGYSGELDVTTVAPTSMHSAGADSMSGTLDRAIVPPLESTQTVTVSTSTAIVGGGLLGGGIFAGFTALAVAMLLIAGAVLWWVSQPGSVPQIEPTMSIRQPVPSVASPEPAVPEPVAPVEPADAATVEPAVAPIPTKATPTPTRPRPQQPSPAPVAPPTAPEPVVAEPVPAPVAEPVAPAPVAPAPVVPAPAPAPVLAKGTVMVTAPAKGLQIRIDGQVMGVTPRRIQLPEGPHTIEVEGYRAQSVKVNARQHVPVIFR